MPTHNSLGISASLLVSDLDKTLSNAIKLRMGTSQKKDAKRIETQLSKGRTLLEKPIDTDTAKVGAIHFVGDDKKMALLAVEASDGKYEKSGPVVYDCADQDQTRVETNLELTSVDNATLPFPSPTQNALVHQNSKIGNTHAKATDNTDGHHGKLLTDPNTYPSYADAKP